MPHPNLEQNQKLSNDLTGTNWSNCSESGKLIKIYFVIMPIWVFQSRYGFGTYTFFSILLFFFAYFNHFFFFYGTGN